MASSVLETVIHSLQDNVSFILRVAITLIIIIPLLQRLHQYQRLQRFKGPFSSGISWLWHSRAVISGEAHVYYGYVTEKYGIVLPVSTSVHDLWFMSM
jgi:hypothetical protein